MIKTQHCEECAFRQWVGSSGLKCLKGHKPRFYMPRTEDSAGYIGMNDCGWKRRCADFEIGKHVQVFAV